MRNLRDFIRRTNAIPTIPEPTVSDILRSVGHEPVKVHAPTRKQYSTIPPMGCDWKRQGHGIMARELPMINAPLTRKLAGGIVAGKKRGAGKQCSFNAYNLGYPSSATVRHAADALAFRTLDKVSRGGNLGRNPAQHHAAKEANPFTPTMQNPLRKAPGITQRFAATTGVASMLKDKV